MYSSRHWYLVQCKPRECFRAEAHLTNQHYTCFLPTHVIKRKLSGTVHTTMAPLFPHYLFVLLNETDNWAALRSTRGVSHLVRFNGVPAKLEHRLVEQLQQHCARLHHTTPNPMHHVGDTVVVTDGCFKELEALVTATRGDERVTLLLKLFNRQQEVDLPVSAIASVA
jgi:transcriptional antiterminator RfaH